MFQAFLDDIDSVRNVVRMSKAMDGSGGICVDCLQEVAGTTSGVVQYEVSNYPLVHWLHD